jgi:ABC-2 type transport system permease protein
MLRLSFTMARFQVLLLLRDRRSFVWLLVLPLAFTAILGFALGGVFGSQNIDRFPVAVYNADHSGAGQELMQVLRGMPKQLSVREVDSRAAAERAVADGDASVAVLIPDLHSSMSGNGGRARVDIVASADNTTRQSVMQTIVDRFGQRLGEVRYVIARTHSLGAATSTQIRIASPGLHPVTASAYYAIGMLVMFMLSNAMNRAAATAREHGEDRYKRLLAAPTPRVVVTFGYFLAHVAVLVVQAALFLACARLLLRVQLGPWGQTILIFLAYAAALAGLATLLGSFVRNQQVMSMLSNLGAQIAAILGGSIVPISSFPNPIQWLARVLPNGQTISALVDSVIGTPWYSLLPTLCYLMGLGLCCGLLAVLGVAKPERG